MVSGRDSWKSSPADLRQFQLPVSTIVKTHALRMHKYEAFALSVCQYIIHVFLSARHG